MTAPVVVEEGGLEAPRQCAGTSPEGDPCGVPPELLSFDAETDAWWCYGHHPGKQEERKCSTARGGYVTKMRRSRGLHPDQLGTLQTPEDAQRWAREIALGAATGQLSAKAAQAATRALSEWVRARDLGTRETRLSRLEQEVQRLRGKP